MEEKTEVVGWLVGVLQVIRTMNFAATSLVHT
jgi:hypothetical protein